MSEANLRHEPLRESRFGVFFLGLFRVGQFSMIKVGQFSMIIYNAIFELFHTSQLSTPVKQSSFLVGTSEFIREPASNLFSAK